MPRFNTSERIRALITNPTKPRVVDYPGHPDVQIGIRALFDTELDGCRVEAMRRIHDIAKARRWDPVQTSDLDPSLLERFVEREIVLRAVLDPDTVEDEKPIPFFSNDHELSQVGATGVKDLMNVYLEHQEWTNPNLTLGPDEEKELVEELGKGQSAGLYLTGFEPAILRRLLISTVNRLASLQRGRSSTTESASSPTSDG